MKKKGKKIRKKNSNAEREKAPQNQLYNVKIIYIILSPLWMGDENSMDGASRVHLEYIFSLFFLLPLSMHGGKI